VKKKVMSLVVALAVVGTVAFAAAPANAAPAKPASTASTVRPAVTAAGIIAIVKSAYDLYKSFKSGGLSVQDATNQIIAAINSAKADIINHIDAIATASAKACAEEIVLDFDSFNVLSPDNQQLFARDATSCLTLINSLQTAVTAKPSLDQLGWTLDFVGPIALIVRSRVGFSNTGITPILVQGNQATISLMAPSCHSFIQEGHTMWDCTAYNGDTSGAEPSFNLATREAGANISWAMATSVLPTVQTL
jgi:hypothetical protein